MDDTVTGKFRPISPNPFIVGNPVRDSAMFFGREAEFDLARKRFQDAEAGHLLVFCGERRSGKTSILYQIAQGRLGPEFIPVLIDMQSMAIDTEADFLTKVSREVLAAVHESADGEAPAEPDFLVGNPVNTFQELIQNVLRRNPGRKLVLCFDEYELFENKIEAGILTQDTLNILSGLMDRQSVFVVFTGSQHIEDRKAGFWRLLPKGIYKRISYLSRADAFNLMTRPVQGLLTYEDGVLEHMHRLTAGQPFYTQALCQTLVDHLNDLETRQACRKYVDDVVKIIVENPFPQMIFLWDGLEREQKLVMALLAEALEDETAHVTAKDLVRSIARSGYPVELNEPTVATTLENLFQDELLLKNTALPAGYAFRMDLWRQWVRRMHSVWQVVREEKIPVPASAGSKRWFGLPRPAAAALAVALLAGVVWMGRDRLDPGGRTPDLPPAVVSGRGLPSGGGAGAPAAPGTAQVLIRSVPENATAAWGGETRTMPWQGQLPGGQAHEFLVAAPGYRDSLVRRNVDAGQAHLWTIELQPLVATLRVESEGPGGLVQVDGSDVGPAPRTLSLTVPEPHTVRVSTPGKQPQERTFPALSLEPGRTETWRVALEPALVWVTVRSAPLGAELAVDGSGRGRTPADLQVAAGAHRFRLESEGFAPLDTLLVIQESTGSVHLALRELPAGVLVILGDEIARTILVDDKLVVGGVQNSGRRPYPPGLHTVEVVLQRTGESVRKEIRIQPGKTVRYDYTRDEVTVVDAGAGGEKP